MRPLVRSEQLKLRMPREIKEVIVQRARELQITQTAYVEKLIRDDNGISIEIEKNK